VLAHSMGRPVVAPSQGCLPEMFPSGTGVLYNPEERDGLVRALAAVRSMKSDLVTQRTIEFSRRVS
jgi:hypothetical protein